MLRYGIPDYRLPQDILDKEIKRIEDLGVEIKCNQIIGKDIPYEDLQKNYDAIFVGIGAHKGKLLGIPNEKASNVFTGTEFLNKINSGETVKVGNKVLVLAVEILQLMLHVFQKDWEPMQQLYTEEQEKKCPQLKKKLSVQKKRELKSNFLLLLLNLKKMETL